MTKAERAYLRKLQALWDQKIIELRCEKRLLKPTAGHSNTTDATGDEGWQRLFELEGLVQAFGSASAGLWGFWKRFPPKKRAKK